MTLAQCAALALALLSVPLFGANVALVGTWRINPQLSVLEGAGSRAIRHGVVTYQMDTSGRLHKTLEGMDAHGHQVRNEDIIDMSPCDGAERPLTSVITVGGQRIAFQGQVSEPASDLLLGHYPFAQAGAFVTTTCMPNDGTPLLTTLIRRDGKLIKTSVTIVSANGKQLTEISTYASNNGRSGGEFGRAVTVWEK
jgi:hypothetical protein